MGVLLTSLSDCDSDSELAADDADSELTGDGAWVSGAEAPSD